MHVIKLAVPIYKDLLTDKAHSVVPAASKESGSLSLYSYFVPDALQGMLTVQSC